MIKRITPEEVVQAFKGTGLVVARHSYFPSHGCACGLGALYAWEMKELGIPDDDGSNYASNYTILAFFAKKYGDDYRAGFANGFDGKRLDELIDRDNPNYMGGYQDGIASWKAVMAEGLPVLPIYKGVDA